MVIKAPTCYGFRWNLVFFFVLTQTSIYTVISAGRGDCWACANAALQSMPRQPMRASTWPMAPSTAIRVRVSVKMRVRVKVRVRVVEGR